VAIDAEEALVAAVEGRATRSTTPCGDGELVWHRWGAGPAVLLLHGGFGSWTHWIRTVDALARRYTVLAVDLPGLGDSALAPEPVTRESLAAIVLEGLGRLPVPVDDVHVVGFSFGGALAGPFSVMAGQRIRSLTLVGSGGLGPLRPPVELQHWRHLHGAERAAAHRHNLATLMFGDDAAIDPLAVHIQSANAARARWRSRPLGRSLILAEALPTIGAPVAAIYGERDATVDPFLDVRLRQLLELRPDIAIHVIPGAGHWVQYERADAFNEILLGLLGSWDSATGSPVA
jgi:pimeloyl-ACP methyl ester carboxylesterase